jgi:hypothetical protein
LTGDEMAEYELAGDELSGDELPLSIININFYKSTNLCTYLEISKKN